MSAFCEPPGTRAYVTNAPQEREGRREVLQPLPECVSLFLFYPGVRFAHPRLSSFRPAGAKFGLTEVVPSRSFIGVPRAARAPVQMKMPRRSWRATAQSFAGQTDLRGLAVA